MERERTGEGARERTGGLRAQSSEERIERLKIEIESLVSGEKRLDRGAACNNVFYLY